MSKEKLAQSPVPTELSAETINKLSLPQKELSLERNLIEQLKLEVVYPAKGRHMSDEYGWENLVHGAREKIGKNQKTVYDWLEIASKQNVNFENALRTAVKEVFGEDADIKKEKGGDWNWFGPKPYRYYHYIESYKVILPPESMNRYPGLELSRNAILSKVEAECGTGGATRIGQVIDAVQVANSYSPDEIIIGLKTDGSALVILGANQEMIDKLPRGDDPRSSGVGIAYVLTKKGKDQRTYNVQLHNYVQTSEIIYQLTKEPSWPATSGNRKSP